MGAHGSQLIDQIRATLGDFAGLSASLAHVVDRPMTADDGFVVHFRMRNGCVGTLQSTASDRGIVVETRVTGSTGTAWIDGVGDTVRVADAAGVRILEVPDSLRGDPPPRLPAGAVTTAYEQMTTFGVEYGPYTRLAAAFRDRIRGVPSPGQSRPPSSTAWRRWRCSTPPAPRPAMAGSGRRWNPPALRRRPDRSVQGGAARCPVRFGPHGPRIHTSGDVRSHHGRGAARRWLVRTGEPTWTSRGATVSLAIGSRQCRIESPTVTRSSSPWPVSTHQDMANRTRVAEPDCQHEGPA